MIQSPSRPPITQDLRAVVLAGGESKRMGQEKSALLLRGKTMLDWVSESVSRVGIPYSVLREDLVPGLGPLGGVRTACLRYSEPQLIFLSCDMPFVGEKVIRQVIDSVKEPGLSAICSVEGRLGFPLSFSSEQLPVVTRRLKEGRRSVVGLFDEIPSVSVLIPLRDFWRFHNVNTRQDLAVAQEMAAQHGEKSVSENE
jgi:molybdenum cofactor guanylyltransferase